MEPILTTDKKVVSFSVATFVSLILAVGTALTSLVTFSVTQTARISTLEKEQAKCVSIEAMAAVLYQLERGNGLKDVPDIYHCCAKTRP